MSKIHICLPYEDELLYSVLTRTRVKDGYIAYTYAAEDFFLSPKTRPDIEFVNAYSDKMMEQLEYIKPFNEWIRDNTLFYYYGHFLPKDRKVIQLISALLLQAMELLLLWESSFHFLQIIVVYIGC